MTRNTRRPFGRAALLAAAVAPCVTIALLGPSPSLRGATATSTPATTRAAEHPTAAVPKVDGSAADWADRAYAVPVMHSTTSRRLPTTRFDAQLRLGWDDRDLLVRTDVTDRQIRESSSEVDFDNGASVELTESDAKGKQLWHAHVSPGVDPAHPTLRLVLNDERTKALRAVPLAAAATARRTATGYVVDARLPWAVLGIDPKAGVEFGVEVRVGCGDGAAGTHLTWSPGVALSRAAGKPLMRLAEVASPPVTSAVDAGYVHLRHARVCVAAAADAAGRVVRVRAGTAVIGTAPLVADGRLATATVTLPMPPPGKPYPPLTAWVDETSAGTVPLGNADAERSAAREVLEVAAAPAVFAGPGLPAVDFVSPSLAEDAIGPYTVRTTYYDADYKPVTTADRPGRYGAVVEVTPATGKPLRRTLTLYRTPGDLKLNPMHPAAAVTLPPKFGVPAAVSLAQAIAGGDYLADTIRTGRVRDDVLAAYLAGLAETPATAPANLPTRLGPGGRNTAWWHELRRRTGDLVPYKRLVHVPAGTGDRKLPLILFLHGSGQRGSSLNAVKDNAIPRILRDEPGWPFRDRFIVVSPQCPANGWWDPLLLADLLDDVAAKYPVDADRVYVTGLSMGGYGTWELAEWFPDRFAAIAPVCGGGEPDEAGRLKELPAWVFHGLHDPTVPVQSGREMVDALRAVGGRVRFTVYPDYGHNSWESAYDDPRLYDWLLAQRRGHPAEPPATTAATRPTDG